jgi:hypothetical protein
VSVTTQIANRILSKYIPCNIVSGKTMQPPRQRRKQSKIQFSLIPAVAVKSTRINDGLGERMQQQQQQQHWPMATFV